MTGAKDMDNGGRAGRWRGLLWGGAAVLLALPAVAMRVTAEVAWGPEDFLVFGAMLLVACALCEGAVHLLRTRRARGLAIAAVGVAFLLVWAELAVGIFR